LDFFAGSFGFYDELWSAGAIVEPKGYARLVGEICEEAVLCTLEAWLGVTLDSDLKGAVDNEATRAWCRMRRERHDG
jgi:hypothetical protein